MTSVEGSHRFSLEASSDYLEFKIIRLPENILPRVPLSPHFLESLNCVQLAHRKIFIVLWYCAQAINGASLRVTWHLMESLMNYTVSPPARLDASDESVSHQKATVKNLKAGSIEIKGRNQLFQVLKLGFSLYF